MAGFIKKHQEKVLIAAAIIIVAGIAWFYAWGIGVLAANISKAIGAKNVTFVPPYFDMQKSGEILKQRGLIP